MERRAFLKGAAALGLAAGTSTASAVAGLGQTAKGSPAAGRDRRGTGAFSRDNSRQF